MNRLFRNILIVSVLLFFISSITGYCENTKPAPEDWQIKGSLAAFDDPHPGVKVLALDKFRELNAVDKFPIERSSDVVKLLENKDRSIRLSAVKFIFQMGEAGHAHASEIVPLLKDADEDIRQAAVEYFTKMGEAGHAHASEIVPLLKDEKGYVRQAAVEYFTKMGEAGHAHASEIVPLLKDADEDVSQAAINALNSIGLINDIEPILLILSPIYDDASKLSFHRFIAHYFGGGNEETEILIKCLGDSGKRISEGLTPTKALSTLDTLLRAWEIKEINRKLRKDLATAIADVVSAGKWKIEDTKKEGCLQKAMASLKNGKFSNLYNNVYIKIRDIERADKTKLWIKRGLLVFFSHLGFWVLLITLYPTSTKIQAVFFWNPWIRKIGGLGYVSIMLIYIPYLRNKLFMPFKESLHSDAAVDSFDEEAYFKDSTVKNKTTGEIKLLKEAITEIKNQIVIESDSGLGKTIFIRYLIKNSKRLTVYLTADKCEKSVQDAIQGKLKGLEKDVNFLNSMLFIGAIDICIDGLNEVSPGTRANITKFIQDYGKANILAATQPVDWNPPRTVKHFILQPLDEKAIHDFLLSRKQELKNPVDDYEERCEKHLAKVLSKEQPQE